MVPGDRISVSSDNGRLTLRGEVPYQYLREAAYNALRSLVGVKSVDDQITIAPVLQPG
jgi:osmotically-inducible protein OsmY